MADHHTPLARAVELARTGMEAGAGYPFGAVIVKAGVVVAEAHNRVLANHDPTAHAEIEALRLAGRTLATHDLTGCVLYASGEPCPMCLGAIYWSGIVEVYYAGTVDEAAGIAFDDRYIFDQFALPPEKRKVTLNPLAGSRAEVAAIYREWAKRQGTS
ncbi:MAG: nucleoside deaminase [Nitrospinae bacterium]|nr:nucleoside deaminase [Nitrospinota bacterium]